jgi:uncharacterized protein
VPFANYSHRRSIYYHVVSIKLYSLQYDYSVFSCFTSPIEPSAAKEDCVKVAIVGSGIAGLAAAHTLASQGAGRFTLVLFEAAGYFGGHTHTVDVTLPGPTGPITHGVDTGFLVFNERTYPGLIALFAALGVDTAKSEMSFSVRSNANGAGRTLEWSGANLSGVFAQRRNILSWRFLRMLRDLGRFNEVCTRLAQSGKEAELRQPLGDFLRDQRFSREFSDWYFLPMVACIWSCPTRQMLEFPVASMIRFCHNHGLLQVSNRPQWWTVPGGARNYVEKITSGLTDKRLNTPVLAIERVASSATGGVRVFTKDGSENFDKIIIATHPDQALSMLSNPSPLEVRTLGAIRFHANTAVLHTDESVLPTRRSAWAAWNYERLAHGPQNPSRDDASHSVCLHYLINKLQPLPWQQSVVVSLNPLREIPADKLLGKFSYAHPILDKSAVAAQRQMAWLQGNLHSLYCGAWMANGFHEDGLQAGVAAAHRLLAKVTARDEELV